MSTADALLAGPRGRRMLLDYVMDAEQIRRPAQHDDSFRSAIVRASHHLDPERDSSVTYSRVTDESGAQEPPEPLRAVVTADEVAHRLSQVPLPEVTEVALRSALSAATGSARYWQDPDGEDVLAATEPVRQELRRVAEHIARSPHSQWWTTPLAETDQWVIVSRGDDSPDTFEPAATELLSDWYESNLEWEARAADRPTDPTANVSGRWWSNPSVRCSTRTLFDGTPAELWFVEDSMGWERIAVRAVGTPAGARIYEIDGAPAWAELCRRFPLEVTGEKRHDWYRTTGRSGRWVIPNWQLVAETYTGVHLTVMGYLAAAGTAIGVDDEMASVIAGWSPDATYWLTDPDRLGDESRTWVFDYSREQPEWIES
ncbi:hypothetical protein [Rhodococcus globerulus]|uniref:hypothetical protein n=1 Tax=Rhodococcus globerulus TaxID=33008 RepID=UPI0021658049|nr:hypothetical protein [Rhodococcus globerulus]